MKHYCPKCARPVVHEIDDTVSCHSCGYDEVASSIGKLASGLMLIALTGAAGIAALAFLTL